MVYIARGALSALLFTLNTLTPGVMEARQQQGIGIQAEDGPVIHRPVPGIQRAGAVPFARTELYFGTARSSGEVTEAEFREFVDQHVTPRFPDGLTLLGGEGQFRGRDRAIVKERSFVLILLYRYEELERAARRIERIRALYKEAFEQESVLRVDDPFIVWVSF